MEVQKIVGMTYTYAVKYAEQNSDYEIRLMKKDGENYIGTSDYRLDRINVEVENDIIVKADVG